jgi:signal transduction histidine kinase
MPRSTPAELRENSRSARQMAVKEADPYFKRMWASHALALDQLAEKIERGEGAAHKAGDTMPADEDLLRPIDRVRPSSTKTMAEGAVLRERREPNEVTLLKQRLQHLQTAFRMLEASERERETQAHRRLDDALRTNRSKTQLLATLGHDLRQPLTVLMATLEVLEPDLLPTRLPVLERAQTAAARLGRALALVMDAAQLDFDGISPRLYPFLVDPLLREVCDQHALDAERKGLRLTMVPCRHEVISDPELLSSILHNLVENAIKYTKAGRVLVGCRRRGGNLSIQVVDTGIGIPKKMLSRIFDEYHQVAHGNGVGLGLFIVKRSANLLGHSVSVRSTPGKGSSFAVEVPLNLDAPRSRRAVGNQALVRQALVQTQASRLKRGKDPRGIEQDGVTQGSECPTWNGG